VAHRLIVRLLFLSLRNLPGGGGLVLLFCGVRLYFFLHRVLVRGFRRFVTHDPKGMVHDSWRQSGGVAFSMRQFLPTYPKGSSRQDNEELTSARRPVRAAD
jgi:hypothetical protein